MLSRYRQMGECEDASRAGAKFHLWRRGSERVFESLSTQTICSESIYTPADCTFKCFSIGMIRSCDASSTYL